MTGGRELVSESDRRLFFAACGAGAFRESRALWRQLAFEPETRKDDTDQMEGD